MQRPATLVRWVALSALLAVAAPAVAAQEIAAAEGVPGGSHAVRASDAALLQRPAHLSIEDLGLHEALVELRHRAGVPIVFSEDFLPKRTRVSCACLYATVGEVLARLLDGTDLRFLELGSQILIEPRPRPQPMTEPKAATLFRTVRYAEVPQEPTRTQRLIYTPAHGKKPAMRTGTITGRVVEAGTQRPLNGAQVSIPGTSYGTLTASDGRYLLVNVPSGEIRVAVHLIGYAADSATVSVTDGETVSADFALDRDVLNLAEVVVTGQATSVARRNLANSVATVSADEVAAVPAHSVEQALAGRVAGADIQSNSGAPGGGMQVRLRGISSIIGAATPLYVVDGVIVSDQSIPSNVHVVTASSSNPVSGGAQDNSPNRIADLNPNDIENIEILKGAAASAIYGSKANNGVIIITTKRGQVGAPQFNLKQSFGTVDVSNKLGLRRFNSLDDAVAAFGPGAADYWQRDVFYDHEAELAGNHPFGYETSLSMSGGSETTRYYASGLVKHDGGVVTGTYYDKQSLALNLNQTLGGDLSLQVNTQALHSRSDRGFTNNDNRSISYWMTFPRTPTFLNIRPNEDGTYPENPFSNSNPLQTAALAANKEDVYRFIGSSKLTLDALKTDRSAIRVILSGGADYFTQRNLVDTPPELQFEPLDGLLGTLALGNASSLNLNGSANAVNTLTPLSGAFTATTSLGVQYEQRDLDHVSNIAQNLVGGLANVAKGTTSEIRENRTRVLDFGMFAQEEILLLDERLLLTAGVRADRSSNNGDPNEFFYYPKASGSYRIPLANGLLNEVKLRAAWGESGNQPLYGQKFSLLTAGNISGLATLRLGSSTAAPDLRPERQREIEGGFDATLFGDRASLDVTGYEKRITDLLLRRDLPPSTGFSQAFFNGGVLRTRGFEAGLNGVPFLSREVEWNSRTTFSLDRSLVVALPVPAFQPGGFGGGLGGFRIEEGKSPTQFVGNDTVADPNDPRCRPDDACNVGDVLRNVAIGEARPDFTMGFSNDLRYHALTVSMLWNWQHGGEVANLTRWLYDLSATTPDFGDPCVGSCLPGETLGQMRRRLYPNYVSSIYLEDASFVKLRELTLTYNVPASVVARLWNGSRYVRLSLSGRNLLTFTDYTGMDPEVANFGSQAIARNQDVAPYPPSRSLWLAIDVGF